MKKENPKTYFLAAEVIEMMWVGLHESGQEDLARALSDSMITQGCQELDTVTDPELILMFWKNYLEENNFVIFSEDDTVH